MNIIELILDEEDLVGIDAMSLVKYPAIEVDFVALKKERPQMTLAKVDKEKRLLIGPALIPNKMINRYNDAGEEYHIYFSQKTVREAAHLFLKANRQSSATVEHEQSFTGGTIVESWIVENETDKAANYGYSIGNSEGQLHPGTWMIAFHVGNERVWQKVKDGELQGFSIEGYFTAAAEKLKKDKKKKKRYLESYTDYPDAVSNNAKRGIELNEKVGNECATQVGKVRAQQLAQGEAVSLETVKRMYSYLSRAETYYDESDTEACGTISYLLWGGKAGLRWAESKLKELGELEATKDDMIVEDVENALKAGDTLQN
jgi:hypothetical protein